MLALKKISIKKLSIYVLIIVFMMGGTGLMLYQNSKLTSQRSAAIDDSALYQNFPAEAIPLDSAIAPVQPAADSLQAAAPIQPINDQGFDLSIFSSDKFKSLEANSLVSQPDSGLGKRDIFKPN